jgi:hypothetical protein
MVFHIFHCHQRRVRVSENQHSHCITDVNEWHIGLIEQLRRRIIVSRQRRDPLLAFHGLDVLGGNFRARFQIH